MHRKTIRTFAAALFLSAATLTTTAFVASVPSAAADAKITTKAVGDALKAAQELQRSRDFKGALAKAREARSAAKGGEVAVVNKYIVYLAQQAGDNATALSTIEEMISSGEIGKKEGEQAALPLALKLGNQEKATAYARDLGDMAIIANAYYKAGNYQQVVKLLQPTINNEKPDKTSLELLASSYYQMHDDAGSFRTQLLLTTYYPDPQHWHDLIKMVSHGRTLDDHQNLELYRLRMATGDLKSQDDYSEMAQIAIELMFPKEAQDTLDKAKKANVLSGERSNRLVTMTNTAVTNDAAAMANVKKAADAGDPNASVQLGEMLWTYGKYPEAEAAVRAGLKNPALKDPDQAKITLAHVLISENKKAEAAQTLNSIPKTSKQAPIAQVWAIYARS
jgi:tetratricopeptide (TPR) repeat protein